jgi:hypothetical protein
VLLISLETESFNNAMITVLAVVAAFAILSVSADNIDNIHFNFKFNKACDGTILGNLGALTVRQCLQQCIFNPACKCVSINKGDNNCRLETGPLSLPQTSYNAYECVYDSSSESVPAGGCSAPLPIPNEYGYVVEPTFQAFEDAVNYCTGLGDGYRLARPANKKEFEAARAVCMAHGGNGCWVDYNTLVDDIWRHSDGTIASRDYGFYPDTIIATQSEGPWMPGEPNFLPNEHCVHIWEQGDWMYNDLTCTDASYYPLCEIPHNGCSPGASSGTTVVKDKIYACAGTFVGGIQSTSTTSNSTAGDLCGSGYHVCRSASEASRLGLTPSLCQYITGNTPNIFYGTGESSAGFTQCTTEYGAAAIGFNDVWGCTAQTTADIYGRNCGPFVASIGNTPFYGWDPGHDPYQESLNVELLDARNGGVLCCTTPKVKYFAGDVRMHWDDAQSFCESAGGSLPGLHNQADNLLASEVCRASDWRYCWFGLRRLGSSFDWDYVDGSPTDFGFIPGSATSNTGVSPWYGNQPEYSEDHGILEPDTSWHDYFGYLHLMTPLCKINYILIYRLQDLKDGYFDAGITATGMENAGDMSQNTYMVIGAVNTAAFRNSGTGKYQFLLDYGYPDGTHSILIWKQTSWLTHTLIAGYEAVSIPNLFTGFGGLGRSTQSGVYISGIGSDDYGILEPIGNYNALADEIPTRKGSAISAALYVMPTQTRLLLQGT